MRIGVYQFASRPEIGENLRTIRKAIEQAAAQSVKLLVFHECALCGYPPLETTMERIDQQRYEIRKSLESIAQAAR